MSELTQNSTTLEPCEPPQSPDAPLKNEPSDHVFRRTFLARLYRADQVAAFERTGDTLAELLNEAGWWGREDGDSLTVREVRAAAEDTELLAGYLAHLAAARFTDALGRELTLLCEQADSWAGRMYDLAEEMRGALVPLVPLVPLVAEGKPS